MLESTKEILILIIRTHNINDADIRRQMGLEQTVGLKMSQNKWEVYKSLYKLDVSEWSKTQRSKNGGKGFWNKLEVQTWRKRVLKYIGGPRMEVEDSGIYWRSKDGGRGFWNILEVQGWRQRVLKYIGGPRIKAAGSKIYWRSKDGGREFWNKLEVCPILNVSMGTKYRIP